VANSARLAEYSEVLRRNCECTAIDEIWLFREGDGDPPVKCEKIRVRRVTGRPLYADYFSWINEVAGPDDISIVANADIYLDEQAQLFRNWLPSNKTVFMLAPWDVSATGASILRDRNDSQDSWVFRGNVIPVVANYPAGVPRCDNRLAYELASAGYRVENPSFSVRTNHLHAGERNHYEEKHHTDFIPPPYGYMWPHNLWPLHRVTAYNYRHPSAKLGWRLDKRRWAARLKLHWFAKASRVLGRMTG
jgi:hypothetical protein